MSVMVRALLPLFALINQIDDIMVIAGRDSAKNQQTLTGFQSNITLRKAEIIEQNDKKPCFGADFSL